MRNWILGLAAVVAVAIPVQADEAAEAIVKKAIDAHGGADALNKMKAGSSKMKGEMSVFGQNIDFTGQVVYEVPGKYKMSIQAEFAGQKLNISQVTNGKAFKNIVNGQPMKLGEAEEKELAHSAAMQEISQLTPLLGKKFTLKAEKEVDVAGNKCAVIQVTGKDFKETKLFFDSKTYMLVKTEHRGLAPGMGESVEVNEETIMSDFKKVNGIVLPMKMTVNHDGKKFMTLSVLEAVMMEKADAKEFAMDD